MPFSETDEVPTRRPSFERNIRDTCITTLSHILDVEAEADPSDHKNQTDILEMMNQENQSPADASVMESGAYCNA